MGVTFTATAVRSNPAGVLVEIDEAGSICDVPGSTLYSILERIEDGQRSKDGAEMFPWYYEAFAYDDGGSPTIADCRPPMDMLKSLQRIEAELGRMKSRLPSEWAFVIPQGDGSGQRVRTFPAFYKGKAVRVFGDDEGCWAVETDTPLGFPPHHDLKGRTAVPVRLEKDGPEVIVAIEETSHFSAHLAILQRLKQVCLIAINHNAVVLTTTA